MVTSTSLSHLPDPPSGFTWELNPTLSDEFNEQTLDSEKWLNYHPYWSGRTPSQYAPANVRVSDGQLQLQNSTEVNNLDEVADPEKDNWVKAAVVSSRLPIASYGYYEARIKAADLSMTSAFWFQGKYSEIDVVEQLGKPKIKPSKHKLMLINTHYYPDGWESDIKTPREIPMEYGAAEDYHVYGVWWVDQDSALFYHDGELMAEITFGGGFNEPMYLFFDTEVFTWEGLPDVNDLKSVAKNTMHIDWVRAWKLIEK